MDLCRLGGEGGGGWEKGAALPNFVVSNTHRRHKSDFPESPAEAPQRGHAQLGVAH